MLFADSVFIGIDPTSGEGSFTCAVLDAERNLLSLFEGDLEEVAGCLAGPNSAVVAVNAPSGPNRGLIRNRAEQQTRNPRLVRGAEMRVCESELRERGIAVSGTPSKVSLCPAWMQSGFELYDRMQKTGYRQFPARDAHHRYLETHPHACFCVLAGNTPLGKTTLEGRIQRQLLLHDCGLRIRDPMDFFEELTRFKLAHGVLPLEILYSAGQLDALAAAFLAWSVSNKPAETLAVGDPEEGRIHLPVRSLKATY